MYRRTRKYDAARLEALRRGKESARMARPAPDYPAPLPVLRNADRRAIYGWCARRNENRPRGVTDREYRRDRPGVQV